MLTNASPFVSEIPFTTTTPEIGMMPFSGANIQIIENPAINSEYFDKSILHTADVLIVLVSELVQIEKIFQQIKTSNGNKIIVFNKRPEIDKKELFKIEKTLESKYHKIPSLIVSTKTKENIEELKQKLFPLFGKIRIYTKEPGKSLEEKSKKPVIMEPNSTTRDVAEKILHGFSKNIKEIRIWGPSSKFGGQKVGLKHILKDMDIIEFKTK